MSTDRLEQLLSSKRPSLIGNLVGIGATFLLFVALGASRLDIELPELAEEQSLEEFTLPPPPPPKPPPPRAKTKPVEIDFSVPIDPTPFEMSLDFLQVSVGVENKAITEVTFDHERAFEDFRNKGLEELRVYERSEVDTPPKPIKRFEPKLPSHLKNAEYRAFVQYRITQDGSATNVIVLDCDLPEAIPAIRVAIRKWKFKPAMKDGQPVECWGRHPISIKKQDRPDNPFARD
ncbi:energy transducer TonB [Pelagicoccus sp. SDUM812003]|uniref:energy transducer TonB n=1 Tax=Pelagicoccus sp. SDUM812003 TaxID=3041267 RepID=UPI0028104C02|nr:energy transducer TonB [Pelagicoccus sp. SDUM812003]MDQ8204773.1 energy transducer TonB [Pelagicoccus sp. SDUM812003]